MVYIQVRHSQKFSETPLNCWIIIDNTGEICCAHCNCMAGLGEVCTHVAAILFYLEAISHIQGKKTCTQQMCQWILPSFLKNVEYLPIADIDFTSPSIKKRKLDSAINNNDTTTNGGTMQAKVGVQSIKLPTYDEMDCFYKCLSRSKSKPAILSLVEPYSDNYVPSSSLPGFPLPLTTLHKLEYESLSYTDLLEACETTTACITESEAIAIHKATVTQFHSKLWFRYRAGRITASCMKSVCKTDHSYPSQSLIKCICYPDQFRFKTKATIWGCTHEKAARRRYVDSIKKNITIFPFKILG